MAVAEEAVVEEVVVLEEELPVVGKATEVADHPEVVGRKTDKGYKNKGSGNKGCRATELHYKDQNRRGMECMGHRDKLLLEYIAGLELDLEEDQIR